MDTTVDMDTNNKETKIIEGSSMNMDWINGNENKYSLC